MGVVVSVRNDLPVASDVDSIQQKHVIAAPSSPPRPSQREGDFAGLEGTAFTFVWLDRINVRV